MPSYKFRHTSSVSNHHPESLLANCFRTLGHIIFRHITAYPRRNHLLYQHGPCKGSSSGIYNTLNSFQTWLRQLRDNHKQIYSFYSRFQLNSQQKWSPSSARIAPQRTSAQIPVHCVALSLISIIWQRLNSYFLQTLKPKSRSVGRGKLRRLASGRQERLHWAQVFLGAYISEAKKWVAHIHPKIWPNDLIRCMLIVILSSDTMTWSKRKMSPVCRNDENNHLYNP